MPARERTARAAPATRATRAHRRDRVGLQLQVCGVDGAGRGFCWGGRELVDDGPLTAIAVSQFGLCKLYPDGTVACDQSIQAPPAGVPYRQIAISEDRVAALDELGVPSYPYFSFPPGVYVEVTANDAQTAGAVRSDGVVVSISRNEPTPPQSGRFSHLALDYSGRACGIDEAGEPSCWIAAPDVTVTPLTGLPRGPFVQIVGGSSTFCALRASGTTACWGDQPVNVPDGW